MIKKKMQGKFKGKIEHEFQDKCTIWETAMLFGLTKVFLNSYNIPWKVLASTEVIILQIHLYSSIKMAMKALVIAQND